MQFVAVVNALTDALTQIARNIRGQKQIFVPRQFYVNAKVNHRADNRLVWAPKQQRSNVFIDNNGFTLVFNWGARVRFNPRNRQLCRL